MASRDFTAESLRTGAALEEGKRDAVAVVRIYDLLRNCPILLYSSPFDPAFKSPERAIVEAAIRFGVTEDHEADFRLDWTADVCAPRSVLKLKYKTLYYFTYLPELGKHPAIRQPWYPSVEGAA